MTGVLVFELVRDKRRVGLWYRVGLGRQWP